ncbi:hypothetical protein [Haloprofundus salinisoli]|uniref:hypothetical protein n=1 Tax=Haloprofundus salinisoli TaxID=2876193 RepID=UPI001CD010B4|nr:hypothetical protein [Haloprofundus salinisoli]
MDANDDPDSVPDCVSEAEIPTSDIVEVIRCAPQPVVNTGYLAERFGVPLWAMYERLEALTETGVLEHMEVRERGHLWWQSLETERDAY